MDKKNGLPEVQVLIHRGSKEIGGTCVQLSTNKCSILLDVGQPLSADSKPIDISKIKADAVLISHPHQDHFGLLNEVDKNIPVYIGELAKRLMDATKIFIKHPLYENNFCFFQNRTPFEIGEFRVTPYLVDHSAVDAYGFLIEAHGKRIFYSGDFRAHGRKSKLFDAMIKYPPRDIDLLFMEGTMMKRSNEEFPDESSVEEKIYETIKDQRNITFIISSSQNIDRIVSVYRACQRTGKTLIVDAYTAWVLEQIKMVSVSTPNVEWDDVGFFADYSQNEVLKNNLEYFGGFQGTLYKSRITKELLRNDPARYVFYSKMSKAKWIKSFAGEYPVNVIYSQWLGYLSKPDEEYFGAEKMSQFKHNPGINFVYAHTSGHSTVEDLQRFAAAINANQVVPIHTEFAKEYESLFNNAHCLNDGQTFLLNNDGEGAMKCVQDTISKLSENEPEWVRLWSGYADYILSREQQISNLRSLFREWKPLKVYISVNDIKNRLGQFSIRYKGQEVGKLKVKKDQNVVLAINKSTERTNANHFGLALNQGEYPWTGKDAQVFRKFFIENDTEHGGSKEHMFESLILEEMGDNTSAKFAGTLRNIQPIKLVNNKLPFQMPIPVSGHGGVPKYSKRGNIDILARIGVGKGTKVGVIELKQDKRSSYKNALQQSIIYSTNIITLLRNPELGDKWWKIFGFGGNLPKVLTVNAIVMIPESISAKHKEEVMQLGIEKNDNKIQAGEDIIQCAHIYFEHNDDRIVITDHNLKN